MPNSSDLRLPGANLTYRVIIDGVKEGHTVEHVTARLADIFARTTSQMQALLAAPRAIVKKQIAYAEAQRFQAALERCGCVAVIEPDNADFSTLVLCHHVSPSPGIAINAPEAWHAGMDGDTFQLLDEASGACLRAVGVTSSALSIREWTGQRMRWLAEDMPYLRQVREPYHLQGLGWEGHVQGIAADYRGTVPGNGAGNGVYSHYLVLCLRSARSLVCLTIQAPAAVFDANEPLYRWLLQRQLDVCDAAPAPIPEPMPGPPTEAIQEDAAPPAPVALSPHDEALQRWLRYNEARPSRRPRPQEQGTGAKPWRPSPRIDVKD